jgi:hypothetical protein
MGKKEERLETGGCRKREERGEGMSESGFESIGVHSRFEESGKENRKWTLMNANEDETER